MNSGGARRRRAAPPLWCPRVGPNHRRRHRWGARRTRERYRWSAFAQVDRSGELRSPSCLGRQLPHRPYRGVRVFSSQESRGHAVRRLCHRVGGNRGSAAVPSIAPPYATADNTGQHRPGSLGSWRSGTARRSGRPPRSIQPRYRWPSKRGRPVGGNRYWANPSVRSPAISPGELTRGGVGRSAFGS